MGMHLALSALLSLSTGAAVAQEANPNPSFYLVNRSQTAIRQMYATPAGLPNWGTDRLSGSVPPGRSAAVRLPADGNCIYDLRIVYAGGRSEEKRGLNTCEADNISFPLGRPNVAAPNASRGGTRSVGNPSVVLTNRSRTVLNELYLSQTGEDSWGEDRLGDDVVGAGGSKTLLLPTGECLYDVRAVFANGEANERRGIDLCDVTTLRVP